MDKTTKTPTTPKALTPKMVQAFLAGIVFSSDPERNKALSEKLAGATYANLDDLYESAKAKAKPEYHQGIARQYDALKANSYFQDHKKEKPSPKNAPTTPKPQKTQKQTQTAEPKKDKDLKKTNLEAHSQKVKDKAKADPIAREKYLYPSDCTSSEAKKSFRRKARATKESYEKIIAQLKASTDKGHQAQLKEKEEQYRSWEIKTYLIVD